MNSNFESTNPNKIFKFVGIIKSIFKRQSQNGNFYGVVEVSDLEGTAEIFVDNKDLLFLEENYTKDLIYIFNLEKKSDGNFGHRINCLGIYKLFDYLANKIKSLELFITNTNYLKNLRSALNNKESGKSLVYVTLNVKNSIIKINLNEKVSINQSLIDNIISILFITKFIF